MSEMMRFLVFLTIPFLSLGIGLRLAETEDAKPNIEIIHPIESIRCVSQDSKIVFCESFREGL